MKQYFSDRFVFSSCNKSQRHQSLVVALLVIFFFAFAAFCMVNALFAFSDAIGAMVSGSMDVMVSELLRSVPLFLSLFMSIWALLLVHAFYRNVSDEKRKASLYKNSIAILCFGIINIAYVIVGRFTGRYLSLVEGAPSPIYPLDSILFSLFFIAYAVFVLIYGTRLDKKLPYTIPSRGPVVTKVRFLYCLGVAIWMLFSLYAFGAFWVGLFVIDFVHGYLLYSIALLVMFFVNFMFLAAWEFYYNELKEEYRKTKLLPLAIVGLVVSLAMAAFYFVALGLNLDGPSNVGFGVLPVAFAASVNIATMVLTALPLIVSIIALIKGILVRRKK